jgi:hypothetical protein
MTDSIDLTAALPRLGWSASRQELVALVGRSGFDRAVRSGQLERAAQGQYTLPDSIGSAQRAAIRVNGVVSHQSAALRHGLWLKDRPTWPTVTVPRGRNLSSKRRSRVTPYFADLPEGDHDQGVTTPLRTVLDCAARLPFAEALVVADAALHRQLVDPDELLARARALPPRQSRLVLPVALHADPRPQSAFESLVRGYSVGIPGLLLVPQVLVAGRHPDLYDERLRQAVECDSFEHHSERGALVSDCERYNDFFLGDVGLLRFAWEHSMHQPGYIRKVLLATVALRERQLGLVT